MNVDFEMAELVVLHKYVGKIPVSEVPLEDVKDLRVAFEKVRKVVIGEDDET